MNMNKVIIKLDTDKAKILWRILRGVANIIESLPSEDNKKDDKPRWWNTNKAALLENKKRIIKTLCDILGVEDVATAKFDNIALTARQCSLINQAFDQNNKAQERLSLKSSSVKMVTSWWYRDVIRLLETEKSWLNSIKEVFDTVVEQHYQTIVSDIRGFIHSQQEIEGFFLELGCCDVEEEKDFHFNEEIDPTMPLDQIVARLEELDPLHQKLSEKVPQIKYRFRKVIGEMVHSQRAVFNGAVGDIKKLSPELSQILKNLAIADKNLVSIKQTIDELLEKGVPVQDISDIVTKCQISLDEQQKVCTDLVPVLKDKMSNAKELFKNLGEYESEEISMLQARNYVSKSQDIQKQTDEMHQSVAECYEKINSAVEKIDLLQNELNNLIDSRIEKMKNTEQTLHEDINTTQFEIEEVEKAIDRLISVGVKFEGVSERLEEEKQRVIAVEEFVDKIQTLLARTQPMVGADEKSLSATQKNMAILAKILEAENNIVTKVGSNTGGAKLLIMNIITHIQDRLNKVSKQIRDKNFIQDVVKYARQTVDRIVSLYSLVGIELPDKQHQLLVERLNKVKKKLAKLVITTDVLIQKEFVTDILNDKTLSSSKQRIYELHKQVGLLIKIVRPVRRVKVENIIIINRVKPLVEIIINKLAEKKSWAENWINILEKLMEQIIVKLDEIDKLLEDKDSKELEQVILAQSSLRRLYKKHSLGNRCLDWLKELYQAVIGWNQHKSDTSLEELAKYLEELENAYNSIKKADMRVNLEQDELQIISDKADSIIISIKKLS